MEILQAKNLDHLGLVIGTFKKFGIIELVNERLGFCEQEQVSPGEVLAAMSMNGLGFASRPLSLTPQFFETKALDVLFGRDVQASELNRHRLGRVLDSIHAYGCEVLYAEIAAHVCKQIDLNQRFTSLDTTSFSVSGEYDVGSDENTIAVTKGYSKDHRPDLNQVVLELVSSQDGGIPLMLQSFDGNASDSKIFKERCQKLLKSFKASDSPRYLVGDSKLYGGSNSEYLQQLKFITRIPRTYKEERKAIDKALASSQWIELSSEKKYYEHEIQHLGIDQRWLVVYSQAARARSEKTLNKQIEKESQAVSKAIMHLRNKEFGCETDAMNALKKLSSSFKFHDLELASLTQKACYASMGRPKKEEAPSKIIYQVTAKIQLLTAIKEDQLKQRSCYVIGTNALSSELSGEEVLEAYKNQNNSIERGFRFLKDPQFFVSSFFVKKPSRIMALLMMMTLSLLIYSVTQKHLRDQLIKHNETLPNQINQPIKNPTMRWVFQMLEGVHVVYVRIKNEITKKITGITEIKKKILRLFFPEVQLIYKLEKI